MPVSSSSFKTRLKEAQRKLWSPQTELEACGRQTSATDDSFQRLKLHISFGQLLWIGIKVWTLPHPSIKRKGDRPLFVWTGPWECITALYAANPIYKLLGKHVYVFICKQWAQNIWIILLSTLQCKQQSVVQDGKIGQSCFKKERCFFQANLKLKLWTSKSYWKHNTRRGRNAAVCKSHTRHIDKIPAKQYNKFSRVTMRNLHYVSNSSWHGVMWILQC